MRKVNNSDLNTMEETRADLLSLGQNAKDLLDNINEQISDILINVKCDKTGLTLIEILRDYTEKKEILIEQIDTVLGEMEHYYDERSEKWRDSEKGQLFEEWRDNWEYTKQLVDESCIEVTFPNSEEVLQSGELIIDIGVTDDFELADQSPEY